MNHLHVARRLATDHLLAVVWNSVKRISPPLPSSSITRRVHLSPTRSSIADEGLLLRGGIGRFRWPNSHGYLEVRMAPEGAFFPTETIEHHSGRITTRTQQEVLP